jgi:hypothetical protein
MRIQMAAGVNKEIELEIACGLFLDVARYSELSINAQVEEE